MIQHLLPRLVKRHSPLDVTFLGKKYHLFGGLVLAASLLKTCGSPLSFNLRKKTRK
jgi:hypothetical protein